MSETHGNEKQPTDERIIVEDLFDICFALIDEELDRQQ
jgi:hypothetical protein